MSSRSHSISSFVAIGYPVFFRCCLPFWDFHHASTCLQHFLFPPAAKMVSQQPCPQGMNCQKGLWLQLSIWRLILTLPAQAQTSKSRSFHEEQIPLASTLWLSPWTMTPQSFLLQAGISQHSILCPSAGHREYHLSACYRDHCRLLHGFQASDNPDTAQGKVRKVLKIKPFYAVLLPNKKSSSLPC